MRLSATPSRDWKANVKVALGLLSLFATVFTVLMPVEAVTERRRAVIRASDGHVYEIEYTNLMDVEDFYIHGQNGEIPSREVAAELYLATSLLNLPPIENPVDLGRYIDEVFTNTAKWKLIHEIAGIIGSTPYKILLAKLTGGASAAEDIADVAALIGGVSYDAAVLVKARMVADTFAGRSEQFTEHYNAHWLSVEQGEPTSVDDIKVRYLSFWKQFHYSQHTLNIVTEHLFLPDWKERVGNYLINLVPFLDTVAFLGDAVLDQVQLNRLEKILESAEADINSKASAVVDAFLGDARISNTVSLLERAGFFDRQPPTIERFIEDMELMVDDGSRLFDLATIFNDLNGDPLEHSVEVTNTNVADAELILFKPDGALVARTFFQITPKRVGTTSVTIEATDPTRLSATQTFTITVVPTEAPNQPPRRVNTIPDQSLMIGGVSPSLELSTYFHDPEGDMLFYTVESSDPAVATTPRVGSQITIVPHGVGRVTITVTAANSEGPSATQTFNVTVTAEPTQARPPEPVGTIPDQTLIEGESFKTVDVSAYFSDPEGDRLIYTASTDTSSVVKLQVENSLLTITSKIAGTATVTVRATDPDGLYATQPFTVTIPETVPRNRAPQVLVQIPAHALTVGNPATLLPVSSYFNDPDGDALTYIASTSNASAVTVNMLGSLVRITPFAPGTATITVTASDGELQATQSFIVTITARSQPNQAPEVIYSIRPQNFRVGDEPKWRNLSGYFSDPDNNTLTYTATSSNSRIATASIDQNSVKITPVAPGTATITVTASDGELQATQSFRVTVQTQPQTIPSLPVCDRTPQVRDRIVVRARVKDCTDVTDDHLEAIRRLSLTNEGLVTLKQGDFDELRNLEELTLNGNALRTLPEDLFWYLRRLEELYLRDNQISILVEDTFKHLDSLTYLTLRGNQITTLQQGAFDDLEMLTELDLSDNQLTTLPVGVFEDLSSLEELTLENNRIAILSSGGFLGLSSLEDLDLDDNPLQTIEVGAFSGLSSLTDLDFYGYPLQTIEAGAFSGLSSLIILDLRETQLTTLRQGAFSGLSSLEDLYLDGSPLRTIEVGAFSGLSSLTFLDLSETQLTTLRQGTFSGLSSLEDLILSDNPLRTIEVGAFSGLSNLTDLNLYEIQLTTLRQGTFSGLSGLEDLDLGENALRTIEVGAFNGVSNLISLDLEENQLAVLPVGIFSGFSRLKRLDLSGNQLNTLPADIFTTLPDLTYLNLRRNPGAPFILTLELARTDNTDVEAAGPATVKVKLAEGAPFEMGVRLSVEGGTLSADIATLTTGQTESNPITLTQTGEHFATVRIESTPTIPQGYLGIEMAAGTPLVLFSEQLNRPPVAVGTMLAQTFAVGDAALVVNVSDKFKDADEDSLHYTASSDNTGVVAVNMSGTQITLVPEGAGNATVTVTASDGQETATQTFSVSVTQTKTPDLVVESVSADKNTVAPGETFQLNAVIKNQGEAASIATPLRYYLSPNTTISDTDTQVYATILPRVAANAKGEPSVTLTAPDTPGTYYYGICVDAVEGESDITNNCSISVAMTVENRPPNAIGTLPPRTLSENDARITVDVAAYFNDPDNTALTYTAVSDNPAVVTAEISGSEMTITPVGAGNATVSVTANDGALTATQTLSVTVVAAPTENAAPLSVGVIPAQLLTLDGEAVTVDFSAYFSDANGDTLTYAAWPDDKSVVGLRREGTLLTITAKAAGLATVTVRARDPAGLQAFQRISVFVSTTEVTELPAEAWMPDANLRAAVRNALGLGPNDTLTQQALQSLTSLRYLGPDLSDNQKITDLTGLERAVNLEHLDLYMHLISDLRPLVGLAKLRSLWLAGNQIANIRPLTNLPLEELDLGGNPINDFAPLSELTGLTRLDFWGNGLGNSHLSSITGLTQLAELDLRNNKISDITSVTKLVNLKKLRLKGNPISDTSPLSDLLRQNPDLEIDIEIRDEPPAEPDEPPAEPDASEGPDLVVASTQVTEIDPGSVFRLEAVIRNQGKVPSADARVRFYLSSDETFSAEDTQLKTSDLSAVAPNATRNESVRITIPKPAGVYYYGVCVEGVADEINTKNNCARILKSVIGASATTDPETGEDPIQADLLAKQVLQKHGSTLRRRDVIDVLPNVLTTLKEPDIQKLLIPATINLVIENPDLLKQMVPTISDKFIVLLKTDAAIKTLLSDPQVQTLLQTPAAIDELAKLLGVSVAPPSTPAPGGTVVFRDADLANKVRKALNLPAGAAIPKAKLATLTRLDASVYGAEFDNGKTINDLTGLEHATALKTLELVNHRLSNITPLAGLKKLETLDLFGIGITDINPLKGLTNLRILYLENIPLRDFTPLADLKKLEVLTLWTARIDDNNLARLVPLLTGLPKLRKLELVNNRISNANLLTGLTRLQELDVRSNQIRDVTPLAKLTNLKKLWVSGNPITNEAQFQEILRQNPGLKLYTKDLREAPSNNEPVPLVLPGETTLLPNYPNPFNPETWIPYQLAKATDVTVMIYDVRGVVVRRLTLGHQSPGFYQNRARAAHWDGRNALGEKVASGLYFYTFTAGDFTATGKMLIRK